MEPGEIRSSPISARSCFSQWLTINLRKKNHRSSVSVRICEQSASVCEGEKFHDLSFRVP